MVNNPALWITYEGQIKLMYYFQHLVTDTFSLSLPTVFCQSSSSICSIWSFSLHFSSKPNQKLFHWTCQLVSQCNESIFFKLTGGCWETCMSSVVTCEWICVWHLEGVESVSLCVISKRRRRFLYIWIYGDQVSANRNGWLLDPLETPGGSEHNWQAEGADRRTGMCCWNSSLFAGWTLCLIILPMFWDSYCPLTWRNFQHG